MITFTLDDKQEKLLREWQTGHDCQYRVPGGMRNVGSFGGADTFMFIPTNVEEIVIVKCACGAEIDLSPELLFHREMEARLAEERQTEEGRKLEEAKQAWWRKMPQPKEPSD